MPNPRNPLLEKVETHLLDSRQLMMLSSSGSIRGMQTCILRGPREPRTLEAYSTTPSRDEGERTLF